MHASFCETEQILDHCLDALAHTKGCSLDHALASVEPGKWSFMPIAGFACCSDLKSLTEFQRLGVPDKQSPQAVW